MSCTLLPTPPFNAFPYRAESWRSLPRTSSSFGPSQPGPSSKMVWGLVFPRQFPNWSGSKPCSCSCPILRPYTRPGKAGACDTTCPGSRRMTLDWWLPCRCMALPPFSRSTERVFPGIRALRLCTLPMWSPPPPDATGHALNTAATSAPSRSPSRRWAGMRLQAAGCRGPAYRGR